MAPWTYKRNALGSSVMFCGVIPACGGAILWNSGLAEKQVCGPLPISLSPLILLKFTAEGIAAKN